MHSLGVSHKGPSLAPWYRKALYSLSVGFTPDCCINSRNEERAGKVINFMKATDSILFIAFITAYRLKFIRVMLEWTRFYTSSFIFWGSRNTLWQKRSPPQVPPAPRPIGAPLPLPRVGRWGAAGQWSGQLRAAGTVLFKLYFSIYSHIKQTKTLIRLIKWIEKCRRWPTSSSRWRGWMYWNHLFSYKQ